MSLTSTLYGAIGRSIISRYAIYAANLGSLMLLARVFSPAEFGTVAAIGVFFVFAQMLAEAGLGPAVINLTTLSASERNGLYSVTLIAGATLALLFACVGPSLERFYGIDQLSQLVPIIAIGIFFYSASILPNALLLREQAFGSIAKAGIAGEVTSTVAAATLSLYIDPTLALASKGAVTATIVFSLVRNYSGSTEFGKPRIGKQLSAIAPLIGFSSYQLGFNFANFFSRNLDNVLVGKYFGPDSLGVYDRAYQLMRYPLLLLTFSMTPAIQPVLRKHKDDLMLVEDVHRKFTFKLSLLGSGAAVVIYIFAEEIVGVLLGEQWNEVADLLRILSLSVPTQVVLSTSGSFFQAMNRTDLLFFTGIISLVAMGTAMAVGIYQGSLQALTICLALAFQLNFIQTYVVLQRFVLKGSLWLYFSRMLPATACILTLACVEFL